MGRAQAHAPPAPIPPVDNFEPPGLAEVPLAEPEKTQPISVEKPEIQPVDNPAAVETLPAKPPDKPPAIAEPAPLASAKPAGKRPAHGSRLPEDWQLPRDWGEWAMSERPDLSAEDVRREAACFADYWHAKAGAGARKADWQATRRNWVRSPHCKPRASRGYAVAHARASPHARSSSADVSLFRPASEQVFEIARQKLFGEVIDATV